MKKFFYWFRKSLNYEWKHCRCFCPTCQYYEACKEDDVMQYENKSFEGSVRQSGKCNMN